MSDPIYREVGILESGQCFGTYSCLLGEPRAATVVAISYCECYSLARHDLEEVVSHWPELAEEFSMLVSENTAIEDKAWVMREELGLPGRASVKAWGSVEDPLSAAANV